MEMDERLSRIFIQDWQAIRSLVENVGITIDVANIPGYMDRRAVIAAHRKWLQLTGRQWFGLLLRPWRWRNERRKRRWLRAHIANLEQRQRAALLNAVLEQGSDT